MKTYPYIFILSILFIFQGCGNRLHNWRYVDRCLKCKENNSLTVEQRNEEFQFKNSAKIAYVSFPETKEMNIEKYFENYKKDSSFDINDFFEVKYLNESQINELSYLVYNIGFKKDLGMTTEANCYYPNNAILFMNENNSLLGYIEICFDCQKYFTSGKDFTLGEQCDGKVRLLKEQFIKTGVNYVSSH